MCHLADGMENTLPDYCHYLVPLPKSAAIEQDFGSRRFIEPLYSDMTSHDIKRRFSGAVLKVKLKAIIYNRSSRKRVRIHKRYLPQALAGTREPLGGASAYPSLVIAGYVSPAYHLVGAATP